ncbi:hypothetical protein DF3PB_5800004 [uncultured Defluviicoccus sp.]|uniref:Uncharacterized protein n=1 Tax=metagenome TaxID=256318 RepID=A0A380TKE5_9ZZZZ|nr:hypothetical protein DF3PB_5800004 [uncultured Defluviicoccus sp.]
MNTASEKHATTGRTIVHLPASGMKAGNVELVQVELASPISPFALVRYTVDGKLQDYGLRLDLDKRAFLDALDDAETNREVRAFVPEVIDAVIAHQDAVIAHQALERALADLQEFAKKAVASQGTEGAREGDRIATAIKDLKVMTRNLSHD